MQSEVKPTSEGNLQPTDIIFDCPQCGKSLAIDMRGAGYVVRCPDCQTDIQVPGMEPAPAEGDESPAVESSASLSLEEKLARLERLRASDVERFRGISRELVLIQSALDRLVGLVDEAQGGDTSADA
ncbi:MAG TPA: hypothetical protein PKE12_09900 [Kiritimatiellia bacterium]|nr:hypothetical protein [Kiritimatiellia bacterium]